jgi:hypothetical protein
VNAFNLLNAFVNAVKTSSPTVTGYSWTTETANVAFSGTITTNVTLAAGSWQISVQTNAGPSARSAAFAVAAASKGPTVTGYTWTTTPTPNQPFSGTIAGTGFGAGMLVWFCESGGTCTELAASDVSVASATSVAVSNVTLAAGSWQIYVQTNAGPSARSTAFTVAAGSSGPPTVTGYTWNTLPTASQAFSGTITGTNFASGMLVWFCEAGGTCWELGASQVAVTNSLTASVINVILDGGSWQVYVQTNAGPSARSTSFTVGSAVSAPTVTGYSWTTETANQAFSGTITGTGFGTGMLVWFCQSGGTCTELASTQISVTSSTSVAVSGVTLAAGSWQIYVQAAAGPSARSAAFTVQGPAPTVTGYTWTTTPTANQPFGGTITGTGFGSPMLVWFCQTVGTTCTELAASQMNVVSATSVTVSGVTLVAGTWQVYVQTASGPSGRSTAFTVIASSATPGIITASAGKGTVRY